MKVLLVDAAKAKIMPPVGLMKIATFHKKRGDSVILVHGTVKTSVRVYDRVYITAVFTYDYHNLMKCIFYYKAIAREIFVGGSIATSLYDRIIDDFGKSINVVCGLLNTSGKLGLLKDNTIDRLPLDYGSTVNVGYKYGNYLFGHTTRGCVRKCSFCLVSEIEPEYKEYLNIRKYIQRNIRYNKNYSFNRNLILMDNNVIASDSLGDIVEDLCVLGYYKEGYPVDYNQGLDVRLMTEAKIKLLAKLNLDPFRIAYDKNNKVMKKAIYRVYPILKEHGIKRVFVYMLYNFTDTVEDLWERMELLYGMSKKYGVDSSVFFMRFTPYEDIYRKHVSDTWEFKELSNFREFFRRGVTCIRTGRHYRKLFGKTFDDFKLKLAMPVHLIKDINYAQGMCRIDSMSKSDYRYLRAINVLSKGDTNDLCRVNYSDIDISDISLDTQELLHNIEAYVDDFKAWVKLYKRLPDMYKKSLIRGLSAGMRTGVKQDVCRFTRHTRLLQVAKYYKEEI